MTAGERDVLRLYSAEFRKKHKSAAQFAKMLGGESQHHGFSRWRVVESEEIKFKLCDTFGKKPDV